MPRTLVPNFIDPKPDSIQSLKSCAPLSAFLFFVFCFFYASAWHIKIAQVLICILYTPRPDYISQRPLLPHTHKSKALASDTTKREPTFHQLEAHNCYNTLQVRLVKVVSLFDKPVLFLVLLQMGPSNTFLVASRKHRPPVPVRASLSKGVVIVYLETMV